MEKAQSSRLKVQRMRGAARSCRLSACGPPRLSRRCEGANCLEDLSSQLPRHLGGYFLNRAIEA